MSRLPPDETGTGFDPTPRSANVVKLRSPYANKLRWHRAALGVSAALNVLLIAAFWLYLHFEGLLSIVDGAVGFFY